MPSSNKCGNGWLKKNFSFRFFRRSNSTLNLGTLFSCLYACVSDMGGHLCAIFFLLSCLPLMDNKMYLIITCYFWIPRMEELGSLDGGASLDGMD